MKDKRIVLVRIPTSDDFRKTYMRKRSDRENLVVTGDDDVEYKISVIGVWDRSNSPYESYRFNGHMIGFQASVSGVLNFSSKNSPGEMTLHE